MRDTGDGGAVSNVPGLCAALVAATTVLLGSAGCGEESCLRGGEECVVDTPCSGLHFECSDGFVDVRRVVAADAPPGGLDALAASGDYRLENDQVVAIIDDIDHPHTLAPSGGTLIDLVTADGDADSLNHIFQVVGLVPGEFVVYDRVRMLEGDGFAAIQVHGWVRGVEESRVVTRYEIRPCEPGIRVRTEWVNESADPLPWIAVDAIWWGGKETIPFAPGQGRGFDQPGLDLSAFTDSFGPFPFMAAAVHSEPASAVAIVGCDVDLLYGFQTEQVSASGLPPRVVPPRDFEVLERFITVDDGRSLGPVTDVALEVRRQLRGAPWAELSGRVVGDDLGAEARATVHVEAGTTDMEREERTPWTQVTPDPDGRFTVRVPASRDYVLEVESFGRRLTAVDVAVGEGATEAGDIDAPPAATLELAATLDGVADHVQVLLHPADDATREDVTGHLLGGFYECAPMLGSCHGPSPACNRVLVEEPVTLQLPPGRYDVVATAGPFATVDLQQIELEEGASARVDLVLERLPLRPDGTLSADLHVHGTVSFDSTIPDMDRVRAFLAAGIDVIAATDHNAVHDYATAMAALGAHDRMALIPGVETTGLILWDLVPGASVPQVIGHYNFWPLELVPDHPRRGAPWDQEMEPGMLMTVLASEGWDATDGVCQLNHPWLVPEMGIWGQGFPREIGIDAREPLPEEYDGTGPGLFHRTPEGADYGNSDFHAQEVMNGTQNDTILAYRALWFYELNQGILRAGTANSDSHGLTDNILGTPRNIVWTDVLVASFDVGAFNESVRAGQMVGTNGPVIEAWTTDRGGAERRPGLEPFEPEAGGVLSIRVTAAPWVPVEEVRIVVNGEVARVLSDELDHPDDPLGTDGLLRFEGEVPLSELLPSDDRDSWIVVEAGTPLALNADLDCNGIPDTGDNDGSGEVDWRDVDWNGDDVVDAEDTEGMSSPGTCLETVGPMGRPPEPASGEEGYEFWAVTPHGFAFAFTNPLVLDRDGGSFTGPGLP